MMVWDNQKLEPVLITFNRAEHLENTLTAFAKAGVPSMRFHVLDNASTDNTREVVQRFQALWPNLQYHCNKYNIGGNANILRALEITDSEYHWVLGDDDAWFLEHLPELITVLQESKADVIRLGWQISSQSRGKLFLLDELLRFENLFFSGISMISAVIIKRELVKKYLRGAYSNISNFYPQLVPVIQGVQEGPLYVYTLKNDLMAYVPNPVTAYFLGDLEWYTIWYKTSLFFKDKRRRIRFNQESWHSLRYSRRHVKLGLPPLLTLVRLCLYFKSMRISQARYLVEIFLYGRGMRARFLLPALAYVIFPAFVAGWLRDIYRKIHRLPVKHPVRDDSR